MADGNLQEHVELITGGIRKKRKKLRLAGKEYVNSKGDLVQARTMGDDCGCRRHCYEKVPQETRETIFKEYYNLASHDEQYAYLYPLIRRDEIARKRNPMSDRRSCTFKYFIAIHGQEIQVCREAFTNIHGISVHKVRVLCSKIEQNIFPHDERGKHKNRPNKVKDKTLNQVREHILSIIETDKVMNFLKKDNRESSVDVNMGSMWKDYLNVYESRPSQSQETPDAERLVSRPPTVKRWFYIRIFHEIMDSEDCAPLKERISQLKSQRLTFPIDDLEKRSTLVKKPAKKRKRSAPKNKVTTLLDQTPTASEENPSGADSNETGRISLKMESLYTQEQTDGNLITSSPIDVYILPLNIEDMQDLSQPVQFSIQSFPGNASDDPLTSSVTTEQMAQMEEGPIEKIYHIVY